MSRLRTRDKRGVAPLTMSAEPPKPAKYTGLRGPSCRKDVAVIDDTTPPVVVMSCPACGHRWQSVEPGTKKH